MALKVVNTESLDAVANAINAKSGTSGALQFPDGFVDAIGAIQAGGGGEDLSTVLAEQEELVAELKSIIAQKAKLGDAKLPSVIDGTVTELTAEDLAGATKIASNAFYSNTSLKSIEMADTITSIESYGFYKCTALASIAMPAGLKKISMYAFSQCTSLTSMALPNGITSIGTNAIEQCINLESINLPDSITDIGSSAFYYCTKLKNVTLPNNLKRIMGSLFAQCYALAGIAIPKSITKINAQAFRRCDGLEYIDLTAYGTDTAFPTLDNVNAFQDCGTSTASGTFEIRVPSGRKTELAAMTNWSTYADNIVEV